MLKWANHLPSTNFTSHPKPIQLSVKLPWAPGGPGNKLILSSIFIYLLGFRYIISNGAARLFPSVRLLEALFRSSSVLIHHFLWPLRCRGVVFLQISTIFSEDNDNRDQSRFSGRRWRKVNINLCETHSRFPFSAVLRLCEVGRLREVMGFVIRFRQIQARTFLL